MRINHRGGVLFTALLLVLFFSFLCSLVVEEAKITNRFSLKTQEFYSAKIIYTMFCLELKQEQPLKSKEGVLQYSVGRLSYSTEGDFIVTEVLVNNKNYQFEKIPYSKKQIIEKERSIK